MTDQNSSPIDDTIREMEEQLEGLRQENNQLRNLLQSNYQLMTTYYDELLRQNREANEQLRKLRLGKTKEQEG